MAREIGSRVRYICDKEFGNQKKGNTGIYMGEGDQSSLSLGNETSAERTKRLLEYAETHSEILWAGNTYPWTCPNNCFEDI